MQELSSIVRKKIIKYYCAQYVTLRLLQHPRTIPTVILIMEWTFYGVDVARQGIIQT